MASISEMAPDIYRISTFVPEWNLQFNQFLVNDEEPPAVSYRYARSYHGNAGRGS